MQTINGILEEIGIAKPAREVYLSLLTHGETTARMLAKRTGITRTSIYDQIKILENHNLVVERELNNKTYFGAGDIRQVGHILDDRIERLEIGKEILNKNMAGLIRQASTVQPKIRFFEGREGVQQMLRDMLWYENITVLMCWPYENMEEVLGKEYLERFNKRRIHERISLKTIWSHNDRKKKKDAFEGIDTLVDRRYMQKGQALHMSYSIYDDKTVFISSSKEAYGFVVQSNEFVELMKIQFELLWENARKY